MPSRAFLPGQLFAEPAEQPSDRFGLLAAPELAPGLGADAEHGAGLVPRPCIDQQRKAPSLWTVSLRFSLHIAY